MIRPRLQSAASRGPRRRLARRTPGPSCDLLRVGLARLVGRLAAAPARRRARAAARRPSSSSKPRPTSSTKTSSRVGSDLRRARMCAAQAAERADDAAERPVVDEHEVDLDGLARIGAVGRAGAAVRRGRADHAGHPGEGAGPPVEPVELEPEDRLALDAPLELGRRADRQDPAVVDDRDPLAQLVGLGHVVGREEDRPARDRGLPAGHELADGARRPRRRGRASARRGTGSTGR